jgi:uncharacterized protein (TIGR02421 family)
MKKERLEEKITEKFILDITGKLQEGKMIRRELPGGGMLHLDRPLPFLVVFRRPADRKDRPVSLLVRAQTTFLIVDGSEDQEQVRALVRSIAKTMSGSSGAFLIVEIWAGDYGTSQEGQKKTDVPEGNGAPGKGAMKNDHFLIHAPAEVSYSSIDYLKKNLEKFRPGYMYASAGICHKDRHPPGMKQLMTADELKDLETLLVGLEIRPFYINPETGLPYPLLLRKLARGLAEALQRTFFEFVRIQTKLKVTHFQMLGRRLITRPAREVDDKLAKINESFRFLLLVTPINIHEAWQEFKKNRFEKKPVFQYRLMPVDPEVLKRELYNIPIDSVEDPTLAFLFREKRSELDKMLTLLAERGRPEFMPGSMQYYGPLEDALTKLASKLLSAIKPDSRGSGNLISPENFAVMARREIDFYRRGYPELNARVCVQDDIAGLIVSGGDLYIGTDAHITVDRAKALIQHEVGTHVLTYFNGRAQPLKQLYIGMPRYEELQEGLAVLSEYLVGGLNPSRLRLLAARVRVVQSIIQGADFVESFRILHKDYGFDTSQAFTITMRVYRGGGLTKDAIYLKGLVRVMSWLEKGHELEPLYIGKIREDYVPLIRELLYRGLLHQPPLRPRFLDDPDAKSRIEQLKQGISVLDLVRP